MPSTSRKQAKFMAACSHGSGYKSCPPKSVSTEFNQADKGTGILRGKSRKSRSDRHPRNHDDFMKLGSE